MATRLQALTCGMPDPTRTAVAGILDRLGFQVGCAASPWGAVEFAARSPLALLVIDLDGAGPEAAPALAGLGDLAHAGGAPTRIVGVAYDQRHARSSFPGLHLCLPAPFDPRTFAACVVGLFPQSGVTAMATGPASAPRPSPIDPAILARLRGCGEAATAEIYGTMRAELAKHDRCLLTAFAAGDLPAMARTAHTLKGASGSVGLLALSACCAELERGGKAGDLATVEALKAAYTRHLGEAVAAIAALLDGLAQPAGSVRS